MKKFYFLAILSCIVFATCNDEPEFIIDPELQPYFDRFKEEAAARNVIIDFTSPMIEAEIVEIVNGGVLGQCVRQEGDANNLIHVQGSYWENSTTTDLEKEFLIFHELGHCTLGKGHINMANSDGNCTSIMYDGNSLECMLEYTLDNREEMLDKLFGS